MLAAASDKTNSEFGEERVRSTSLAFGGAFIKDYWDGMPNEVQDEYSRPDGTPYRATINAKMFAKLKKSKNGVRDYGRPPESGGSDGWVATR